MTQGGPGDSSTTFMFYLFRNAFGSEENQMGYASAQAWILFVIVVVCAWLVFKSSARWVFYEGSLNE
jgi:multiple sugar transport system permease protein